MPLAKRKARALKMVEQLEERCLFAAALPSDLALPIDGTMAFGDVNGDGKLDMVQATFGTDFRTGVFGWGVDLYLNRGAGLPAASSAPGQLRLAQHLTAIPMTGAGLVFGNPTAVVGDVNGDGKNDIVVYVIENGGITTVPHGGILLGDGKGGFRPGGTFDLAGMTSSDANWGLSLADFNGDKRPDLFVYTYTAAPPYTLATAAANVTVTSTVGVAINNGAGSFRNIATANNPLIAAIPAAAAGSYTGKNSYFRVLGAGDINGDGKAEIISQLDTDTVGLATIAGVSPLTFSGTKTIVLPGAQVATGSQIVQPTTASTPLGNVLSPPPVTPAPTPIFGSLPKPGAATTPLPTAKPAFAFLTDANRDGLADIAVLRGSTVYVGINRSPQVALSQRPALGWKQFTVAVPMNPLGITGNTTMMMFVGDLDGKGTQTMCFLVPGIIDQYAILGTQPLPPA